MHFICGGGMAGMDGGGILRDKSHFLILSMSSVQDVTPKGEDRGDGPPKKLLSEQNILPSFTLPSLPRCSLISLSDLHGRGGSSSLLDCPV